MSFLLAVVGLVLTGVLTVSTGAHAQTPPDDSVIGVFTVEEQTWAFDVHSGPSGESPSGVVTFQPSTSPVILPVTCLTVSGNRATVGVFEFGRPGIEFGILFFVEDNDGQGQDTFRFINLINPPPTSCPIEPLPGAPPRQPIDSGDITVTDAVPFPTSKDQCKNGGWRNFPGFSNEGLCVAFVQRGVKPAP